MNMIVALKVASGGSEVFYDQVLVPWAAAVPENDDILREKWESVTEASLG